MDRSTNTMLCVGAWCVNPASGQISRDGETIRLEARNMGLLLCLTEHAGEVVSIDDLLTQVWPGVLVTPDSVYQAVASLRRVLGDDPKQPTYIATVPRLGYRLVATVRPWTGQSGSPVGGQPETSQTTGSESAGTSAPAGGLRRKFGFALAAGAVFCCALVTGFLLAYFYHARLAHQAHSALASTASQRHQSIAVLPFLDLTDDMKQEPFADGMTEELIDKFSKIPGMHVPAPTASFYFKGKQMPIVDIAKKLGVACVLDGSVRKSGSRLRVAARLIRADSGFVIWSETYDRPLTDVLVVQDEIADEVTKRLKASIEEKPDEKPK